jgi:hypothetical protein
MKKIIVLLLVIILGLVLGLSRERARYEEQLKALAQSDVQALTECRKSVAELKFQCQVNETGFEETDPVKKLTELQARLQTRRLQTREKTIDEMIEALELNIAEKPGIISALEEFDRRRRALIGRSREDRTYLTPGFYENLNQLREETARELKEKLTEDQWNAFVADDFLQRLGLSPEEPSQTRELPSR